MSDKEGETLWDLMPWICKFGFHNYGKWGVPFNSGFSDYQDKKCKECGRIKQRKCGWSDKNK